MIEPIFEENLTDAQQILTEGFIANGRNGPFWDASLKSLVAYYRLNNISYPFGFLARADGACIGVILCIYNASSNCISLSSWYVRSEFRGSSYPMIRAVMKFYSGVEIRNFSATSDAVKLMKILGFKCIEESATAVMPALGFGRQWQKLNREAAKRLARSLKIYANEYFDAFLLNENDDAWVIIKNVSVSKKYKIRRACFLIARSDCVTSDAISQLASLLFISGKILVSPRRISSWDVVIRRFPLLIKSASSGEAQVLNYWENSELAILDF